LLVPYYAATVDSVVPSYGNIENDVGGVGGIAWHLGRKRRPVEILESDLRNSV